MDSDYKADFANVYTWASWTLLFLLVLIPLALASFTIYKLSGVEISSFPESINFTIIMTVFALNIAIAAIVPFFISTIQVRSEAREVAKSIVENKNLDLQRLATTGFLNNKKTDSHMSRMVARFLFQENSHIWSIGWSSRSLKRYFSIIDEKPEYAEFIYFNVDQIFKSIRRACEHEPRAERRWQYDNLTVAGVSDLLYNGLQLSDQSASPDEANKDERFSRVERACKDLIDLQIIISEFSLYKIDYFKKNDIAPMLEVMKEFVGLCLFIVFTNRDRYTQTPTRAINELARSISSKSDFGDRTFEIVKSEISNFYVNGSVRETYLMDGFQRLDNKIEGAIESAG